MGKGLRELAALLRGLSLACSSSLPSTLTSPASSTKTMCPSQQPMPWPASCLESSCSRTGQEHHRKSRGRGGPRRFCFLLAPSSHPLWSGFLHSPHVFPSGFSSSPITADLPPRLLQAPALPASPTPLALALPPGTPNRLLSPTEGSPAKALLVFHSGGSSWPRVSHFPGLCSADPKRSSGTSRSR